MKRSRHNSGIIATPLVVSVGLVMMLSLWILFETTIQDQQVQAGVTLRTDFHQREAAFSRALLAVLPNKMIGCMKANSNSQASQYTWSEIFTEAIAMANANDGGQTAKWTALGINGARTANPADGSTITVTPLVPVQGISGTAMVNSGTSKFISSLLAKYPNAFPEPLNASSSVMDSDCIYPLITTTKQYTTNNTGTLQASVASYPLYNMMSYPQIRFPLTQPGNPFLAKRNWWAFSVTFSSAGLNGQQAMSVTKNYVLSVYEVPSQLPVDADALTILGQHADGTSWSTANKVRGTVYADSLSTKGGFDWQGLSAQSPGALSRNGTTVTSDAQSTFSWINPSFDNMGSLELWQAANNQQVGQMGSVGDSGKVAFIPIEPDSGSAFYLSSAIPATPNSISPTLWDTYSIGANQCSMSVRVVAVANLATQSYTPTDVLVTCSNSTGTGQLSVTLTRDKTKGTTTAGYIYWPQSNEDATQPFQTEQLTDANGQPVCGLIFMPTNLENWLANTFHGAAGVYSTTANAVLNNRIYFDWDPSIAQTQTSAYQTGVVIGDPAGDLTRFNAGLAVVSAPPVYLESDINTTQDPARALADPSHPYPPVAIFSYDLFVGTKSQVQKLVITNGQRGTLKSSRQTSGTSFYPLDIKTFATNSALPDSEIQLGDPSDSTSDGLVQISNPSQLPPVSQMNWLITLDEIGGP